MNTHQTTTPPYDLFHCLGNESQAWFIIIGSIGVVIWYLLIAAFPWRESVRYASESQRKMGIALIVIFIACGFSGYFPNALSGWYPRQAYWIREVTLVVLNICCPLFFVWSRHTILKTTKRTDLMEKAVESFFEQSKERSTVTESEAMRLIAELQVIREHAMQGKELPPRDQ